LASGGVVEIIIAALKQTRGSIDDFQQEIDSDGAVCILRREEQYILRSDDFYLSLRKNARLEMDESIDG